MSYLHNIYSIAPRLLLLLALVMCSCEQSDVDMQGEQEGAVLSSMELDIPLFERFEQAAGESYILVKMVGAENHEEYLVPMVVAEGAITRSSDEPTMRIESSASILGTMPLQRYYLNEIIYSESSVASSVEELEDLYDEGSVESRSLGAILSAESSSDIYFVSSFNYESEVVGRGSSSDPYTIATASDLAEDLFYNIAYAQFTGEVSVYSGETILQTADIDLAEYYSNSSLYNSWTPLGTPFALSPYEGAVAFCGTYDGGGFTIHNMTADSDDCLGFFRSIASGAVVKNLTFTGVKFSGKGCVGVVAAESGEDGYDCSSFTIDNVNVSGYLSIESDESGYMGGFVGRVIIPSNYEPFEVTISNSLSSVCMETKDPYNESVDDDNSKIYVGGFIGYVCRDYYMGDNNSLSIKNSNFNGAILGEAGICTMGGLIGYIQDVLVVDITRCGVSGLLRSTSICGGVFGSYVVENYYDGRSNDLTLTDVVVGGFCAVQSDGISCDLYETSCNMEYCNNGVNEDYYIGGIFGSLHIYDDDNSHLKFADGISIRESTTIKCAYYSGSNRIYVGGVAGYADTNNNTITGTIALIPKYDLDVSTMELRLYAAGCFGYLKCEVSAENTSSYLVLLLESSEQMGAADLKAAFASYSNIYYSNDATEGAGSPYFDLIDYYNLVNEYDIPIIYDDWSSDNCNYVRYSYSQ